MSANVKIRYKGTNPDFTYDGIYQSLGFIGDSTVKFVLLTDSNQFVAFNANDADIELVSITYPGEVQIYP